MLPALYLAVRSRAGCPGLSQQNHFCMAADALLEVHFVTGVCVCCGSSVLYRGNAVSGITGSGCYIRSAVLCVCSAFAILRPYIRKLGKLAVLGALYVAFLCAMCSMAGMVFLKSPGLSGAAALLRSSLCGVGYHTGCQPAG